MTIFLPLPHRLHALWLRIFPDPRYTVTKTRCGRTVVIESEVIRTLEIAPKYDRLREGLRRWERVAADHTMSAARRRHAEKRAAEYRRRMGRMDGGRGR